jgi:hypothetical protein|nr:MAG TPA: hypothetical protein [Caudoviricetes sp.]
MVTGRLKEVITEADNINHDKIVSALGKVHSKNPNDYRVRTFLDNKPEIDAVRKGDFKLAQSIAAGKDLSSDTKISDPRKTISKKTIGSTMVGNIRNTPSPTKQNSLMRKTMTKNPSGTQKRLSDVNKV